MLRAVSHWVQSLNKCKKWIGTNCCSRISQGPGLPSVKVMDLMDQPVDVESSDGWLLLSERMRPHVGSIDWLISMFVKRAPITGRVCHSNYCVKVWTSGDGWNTSSVISWSDHHFNDRCREYNKSFHARTRHFNSSSHYQLLGSTGCINGAVSC